MEWLRKYKFKNSNNDIFNLTNYINYLSDKNLSNFKYLNKRTEEEFIKGKKNLLLKCNNIIKFWYINSSMVEKDLKEIRKNKLNKLKWIG